MWHQFYQNLLNNILRGGLLPLLLLIPKVANAQGFYQNFEKINNLQKENYTNLIKKYKNTVLDINDIKDFNKVHIDQTFLSILLFNTPKQYIPMATKDKCSLYDLILAELIKSPEGEVKLLLLKYLDQANNEKKAVMTKKLFVSQIVSKVCPNSIKLNQYFKEPNIRKTLSSISLTRPKSEKECKTTIKKSLEDVKTPYYCHINNSLQALPRLSVKYKNLSRSKFKARMALEKKINRAKMYNNLINESSKEYIQNLCQNLIDPEKFCQEYFSKNYWSREAKENQSPVVSKTYCPNPKSKTKCLKSLSQSPAQCHFKDRMNSSLMPWPNCNQLSKSLPKSRLYKSYQDCPAKVGNLGVIIWSRILNHYTNGKYVVENQCQTNGSDATINFSGELTEFETWKNEICYDDKIKRKYICYPVLFNDNRSNVDYSLVSVIGKIANKLKGYNYKDKPCKIILEEDYKPTLLEFKSGCFIMSNDNECKGAQCKFKVILDQLQFNQFEIKNDISFDILPSKYQDENKSFKKLYEKSAQKTFKRILNVSSLELVFKNHSNAVLLGYGCAQDLLPSYFRRETLNQCTPLPFIVDGYIEDRGLYSMNVITAVDHIHAPRIIPWSYVFASVKGYQAIHPLNTWGLYAIY